jgi:hypothetical protein
VIATSEMPTNWLRQRTDSILVASAEIGFYSAAGTAVQAWGLTVVPAATAGFLIQFTIVITPTLVALSGQPLSPRGLMATGLATVGMLLTAADGLAAPGSDLTNLDFSGASGALTGRLAILAAACCYSLVTLRMSVLAPGAHSTSITKTKGYGTKTKGSLFWFRFWCWKTPLGTRLAPFAL